MNSNTCGKCRFCVTTAKMSGIIVTDCRRFPPAAGAHDVGYFPRVNPDDIGCGEFQPIPESPKKNETNPQTETKSTTKTKPRKEKTNK